jgi:AraC-like DNA-binding protein
MNFYERELIVKNLFMRLREQPKGHTFYNPQRESASLLLLLEGELSVRTETREYAVHRGECLYLPKGIRTKSSHLGKYNKVMIFYFQPLEGEISDGVILFPSSESALGLAQEIEAELLREGALDSNYLRFAFYKLLWLLSGKREIPPKYRKVHSLVLRLERQYTEELSLSDYARLYLMSESSLRALFKEYTGKSVVKYRNLVRLRHANELIRDGLCTTEAAYAVGFSSVSYYCRLAKKYAAELKYR